MKNIILPIPFLLIFSGHAIAGIFGGPDNYDECISEKMKGVDLKTWYRVAKEPAERACQWKFEVEIKDLSEIDFSWSSKKGGVRVNIEKNLSDFEITRANFVYSSKSCDAASSNDFNVYGVAEFKSMIPGMSSKKETTIDLEESSSLKCQRTISVYGKRVK